MARTELHADGNRRSAARQRRAAVFLLYMLAMSVVLTVFTVHPGFEGHPRATFLDQIDGRAHRPFGGQILVSAATFLFSAGILTLWTRSSGWFLVVFALTMLNKETSALLVPLYWIRCRAKLTPRRLLLRVAGLVALWLLVRALAMYVVRDNPGQTLESHFIDHNLRLPWVYPLYFAYTVFIIAIAVWLVRRDWRTKPAFLRAGLWITLVPLAAASLFFGFADELRGYYEAFPFLFLLSVPSICSLLGLREEDAPVPR